MERADLRGVTVNGIELAEYQDAVEDTERTRMARESFKDETHKHNIYRKPVGDAAGYDRLNGPIRHIPKGEAMRELYTEALEGAKTNREMVLALLMTKQIFGQKNMNEIIAAYKGEQPQEHLSSSIISQLRRTGLGDEIEVINYGSKAPRTYQWKGRTMTFQEANKIYLQHLKEARVNRAKKKAVKAADPQKSERPRESVKSPALSPEVNSENRINISKSVYQTLSLRDLVDLLDDFGFDLRVSLLPRK